MKTQCSFLLPAVALTALVVVGCKPAGNAEEESITPEVTVQVAQVVRTNLRATITAYGVVEPAPAQSGQPGGGAKLAAPAAGIVFAVPATEGQRVKTGDIIVRLDDRMALAAVDKAKHTLAFAVQVAARQRKLQAVDGTSEKTIQEAQQQLATAKAELASAQAALAFVQLASPLDGIVTRIRVQPGQAVDANTVVAEVVDLERLVADITVPAAEATAIKAGQRAQLLGDKNNEVIGDGAVTFVSPSVDPTTGQTLVRIGLPKDAALRPGQFISVRIVTAERTGRLAVPRAAVYTDNEGQSTLSIVENNVARQKVVKTGLRDGVLVEVEGKGITEGAMVVTVGSYALPAETKVHVVTKQTRE